MLALSVGTRVYLACGITDMRKSFHGLAGIVAENLGRNPCSGEVFVFCNRRRDRIKILFWDGSGLCVYAKRLEKGTFAWPSTTAKELTYTPDELLLLLSGIDLQNTKRRKWYRRSIA